MKKTFIALLAAMALSACRSTQERKSVNYRQDAISDVVSYKYSRQQRMFLDSTRQWWSFYSDSAFTFYPDGGLQASSGYLLVDQTAVVTAPIESAHALEEQQAQKQHTSSVENQTTRTTTRPWIGLVALLILLVLVYGGVRRMRRPL